MTDKDTINEVVRQLANMGLKVERVNFSTGQIVVSIPPPKN